MAELIIIAVLALTLGLGASCVVLCFHETWDYNFSNNNHNRKFTSSHLCLVSHGGLFPALSGSCRKSADLSGNPVHESCWYCLSTQRQSMVPRCEVYLTLKNEWEAVSQKIQNDDSERNISLRFRIFFTNDEFERMAFFLFLSFWMLKIRIFNEFFF